MGHFLDVRKLQKQGLRIYLIEKAAESNLFYEYEVSDDPVYVAIANNKEKKRIKGKCGEKDLRRLLGLLPAKKPEGVIELAHPINGGDRFSA